MNAELRLQQETILCKQEVDSERSWVTRGVSLTTSQDSDSHELELGGQGLVTADNSDIDIQLGTAW